MKRTLALFVGSLLLCTGCAGVASLAETMNSRGIASCIHWSGAYTPFVGVHGVTVTGGASLQDCMRGE